MLTVKNIIRLVSEHTGISVQDIMGTSRHRPIAHARFAAYYVARRQGLSYPQIGKRMGRDHGTVIHGYQRAHDIAKRDFTYADMLAKIERAEGPAGKRVSYVAPYAPRNPIKPTVPVKEELKPDNGHMFHKQVAVGSAALLAALRNAA